MRESGQSDDELTNALRHDDIDKVQLIVTSKNAELSQYIIPYNIFEDAIPCSNEINLIDYAATYGSIKCFKYLMLNHLEMTNYTFYCAVLGGNTEIIHICYQKKYNFKGTLLKSIYYDNTTRNQARMARNNRLLLRKSANGPYPRHRGVANRRLNSRIPWRQKSHLPHHGARPRPHGRRPNRRRHRQA